MGLSVPAFSNQTNDLQTSEINEAAGSSSRNTRRPKVTRAKRARILSFLKHWVMKEGEGESFPNLLAARCLSVGVFLAAKKAVDDGVEPDVHSVCATIEAKLETRLGH